MKSVKNISGYIVLVVFAIGIVVYYHVNQVPVGEDYSRIVFLPVYMGVFISSLAAAYLVSDGPKETVGIFPIIALTVHTLAIIISGLWLPWAMTETVFVSVVGYLFFRRMKYPPKEDAQGQKEIDATKYILIYLLTHIVLAIAGLFFHNLMDGDMDFTIVALLIFSPVISYYISYRIGMWEHPIKWCFPFLTLVTYSTIVFLLYGSFSLLYLMFGLIPSVVGVVVGHIVRIV